MVTKAGTEFGVELCDRLKWRAHLLGGGHRHAAATGRTAAGSRREMMIAEWREERVAHRGAVGIVATADLDLGDAGADRHDLAGPLVAADERQRLRGRRRIEPRPEIGVDIIDASGMLLDPDLARPRRWHVDFLIREHFRPAVLMNPHRCDHDSLPLDLPCWVCRVDWNRGRRHRVPA